VGKNNIKSRKRSTPAVGKIIKHAQRLGKIQKRRENNSSTWCGGKKGYWAGAGAQRKSLVRTSTKRMGTTITAGKY